MKNWPLFMERCLKSIEEQSFTNYEIVMVKVGKMAETTNACIKRANGELIKVLYLDDMLAHKDALRDIVENFKGDWMITGTDNNPYPYWTDDIGMGNNKLGSPSALTIRNDNPLMFDERMSWLLDCDYYKRMYDRYGEPEILDGTNVIIGIHDGQMTNILTDKDKADEEDYLNTKNETTTS